MTTTDTPTTLTERLARLRYAHVKDAYGLCDYCGQPWPCDTEVVLQEIARLHAVIRDGQGAQAAAVAVADITIAIANWRMDVRNPRDSRAEIARLREAQIAALDTYAHWRTTRDGAGARVTDISINGATVYAAGSEGE